MATSLARTLRRGTTETERLLWSRLRDRRLDGWKFKRQVPRGPYVVDFICLQARLIVEVDGGQHALQEHEDAERTAWLEAEGFRVARFWNNEVLSNLDGVLETILVALQEPPSPTPSPRRGEGVVSRPSSGVGASPPARAVGTTASIAHPEKPGGASSQRSEPPLPTGGEGRGEGTAGSEDRPDEGAV